MQTITIESLSLVITIVAGIITVAAVLASPINTYISHIFAMKQTKLELLFSMRATAYSQCIAHGKAFIHAPTADNLAQFTQSSSTAELYASVETFERISDFHAYAAESLLHLSHGFIDDVKLFNKLVAAHTEMIYAMQKDMPIPN